MLIAMTLPVRRRGSSDVAGKGTHSRRLAHLVDDVGHGLGAPLRLIEIVLLDEADEIAAAQHLLTDLCDALLDLPGSGSLDDIGRKILGFDQHGRR